MPTTTINWPDDLGCSALQDGYELKPVSTMIRTSLSDGRAFQRRKYMSAPMNVSLTWIFTEGEYMLFDSWLKYTLLDGVKWFNMPLKTSLGYDMCVCRFTDIYDSASIQQGRFWKISASLEIYIRPVLDPEWSQIVPGFVAGSDIFDIAMCREWPVA